MARFLKDRKNIQGAAPGSLIFIGQQKIAQNSIHILQYKTSEVKEYFPNSVQSLQEYLTNDHITWINICGLHNTKLIADIGQIFDISSLILEDILNTDQRPRFSEENKHLYIIIKSFNISPQDQRVHMEQISIIVGSHYLISIQETDSNYFKDVKKRIFEGKTKIRSFGSDYLCYALLDTLVDNYIINLEILGSQIEEEEKKLLTSQTKNVEEIYHFKTELSYIRKNVRPVKEIMTRFIQCDTPLINKKTYTFLRDLEDLVLQVQEAIEIYYAMVSDQLNIYQTNISNKVNDVMKVLTIFSTIFIPLTFIAGIYGMNFKYMPELQYRCSYFILWAIMIAITAVMLYYFKRKKWL